MSYPALAKKCWWSALVWKRYIGGMETLEFKIFLLENFSQFIILH